MVHFQYVAYIKDKPRQKLEDRVALVTTATNKRDALKEAKSTMSEQYDYVPETKNILVRKEKY
jgi:hypothetical protein